MESFLMGMVFNIIGAVVPALVPFGDCGAAFGFAQGAAARCSDHALPEKQRKR